MEITLILTFSRRTGRRDQNAPLARTLARFGPRRFVPPVDRAMLLRIARFLARRATAPINDGIAQRHAEEWFPAVGDAALNDAHGAPFAHRRAGDPVDVNAQQAQPSQTRGAGLRCCASECRKGADRDRGSHIMVIGRSEPADAIDRVLVRGNS